MTTLRDFLEQEIAKDEAEAERFRRIAMLGLAEAWEKGYDAGVAGEPRKFNPYL